MTAFQPLASSEPVLHKLYDSYRLFRDNMRSECNVCLSRRSNARLVSTLLNDNSVKLRSIGLGIATLKF